MAVNQINRENLLPVTCAILDSDVCDFDLKIAVGKYKNLLKGEVHLRKMSETEIHAGIFYVNLLVSFEDKCTTKSNFLCDG